MFTVLTGVLLFVVYWAYKLVELTNKIIPPDSAASKMLAGLFIYDMFKR
jgi:hypothetical protein